MARDPFKVDQLQIEPGTAGTRLVRRAGDGSLEFLDARVTGGITLSQLAGLKAVQNILVVGKAGAGAGYTTIQSALDTIPSSSSPTNPYLVLIGPGVYQETLNIVRDGVHLLGMGAVLQSALEATPNGAGAYHTVVVQSALGTIPTKVTLENLTITNAHDNFACVRVVGGAGSTVGLNGIRLVNVQLEANAPGGNRTMWSTAANTIHVQGGSMKDPVGLGLVLVQECALAVFQDITETPAFSFRWDVAESTPANAHQGYFIQSCSQVAANSSLSPEIELVTSIAPDTGTLLVSGIMGTGPIGVSVTNGVCRAVGCELATVTSTNALVYLEHCYNTGLVTAGTGKIAREVSMGSAAFVATSVQSVTFAAKAMSANFTVSLETDSVSVNPGPWVSNKTTSGFDIHFGGAENLGVNWVAFHND